MDLRDQAPDYAAAWRTFERLDEVAPHRADWATWAAGHQRHTLFMALVRDPLVLAKIGEVQRSLGHVPGLELHAAHFLHVSIQACGFDDALALDLERVAAALREVPRFDVVLGGVNAFHSALFLETHSGGGLLEVRRALRRAIGPAIETIDPFPGLLFHLTLGYFGDQADARLVRAGMAAWRDRAVARCTIERIHLVQVPTDQLVAYPALESIESFPLAGGPIVERL